MGSDEVNIEDPLSTIEKIQVLMMEYNNIKTEIFDQSKIMHQIFAAAAGVTAPIMVLTFDKSRLIGVLLLTIQVLFVYAVSRMTTYVAREGNERLLEIERKINRLAKTELLAFERRHGMASGADERRVQAILEPLLALGSLNLENSWILLFFLALLMLAIGVVLVATAYG